MPSIRSDISRHVMVLFVGHSSARLLSLAGLALLLSYSDSQSIGLLGIWMSASVVISILLSARLEFPMVAARKKTAATLFGASIWLSAIGAGIIGISLFIIGGYWWGLMFALVLFLRSSERVIFNWATRTRMFSRQSRAVVVHSVVRNGAFALLAVNGMLDGWNLVVVDLIALGASVAYIFLGLPTPSLNRIFRRRALITREVKRTAFYNGLSAFAEAAALQAPTAIVGSFFGLSVAGNFHMATRLPDMIRTLIVAAISNPIFNSLSRAARRKNDIELKRRYTGSLKLALAVSLPFFLLLIIIITIGKYYVDPGEWELAVKLVYYLAPAYLFLAITAPLYRLFTIMHSERIGFIINLLWGGTVAAGFFLSSTLDTLFPAVIIFGIASALRMAFVVLWQSRHITPQ